MHGAYTGAQFMTFKLVQKTMQNHHKNEDKNNIEKKRFPGSLPQERAGREVYPDIKGGTTWMPPLLILDFFRDIRWARWLIVFGDAGKDSEE